MKKSKKLRFCAAVLVCTLFLWGCSSKSTVSNDKDSSGDVTTITFFGNKYETENVRVIEEIISGFMKENPDIRVSYESLKGNEYFEALEKRMASGKGDDVFMVNHDILLKLKEKGQVADLSGLSTISDYTDQMLSQMDDEGKVYWMPTTVSVFGLYCNMDLLKEHKQKVPENLQEWQSVCSYFADKGITPIVSNNDISLKTLAIGKGFYSLYQEDDQAKVFEALNNGEEKLSKYLQPGFSLAEQMIKKGYVDSEKALKTEKTSDDLAEFAEGKSPFMLTGAWAAGRTGAMNPDFEFKVEPLPLLENGSLLVINADTRLSVNADSRHAEAAKKFVEYFTQAENIQRFADQQCSFSPLKEGTPSSVKTVQPLAECYKTGKTVIGTDSLLKLPIWNLTADASKQLLLGKPLKSVLNSMDRQAEKEREMQ
ncbi:ABC transporter substrate-binding protein [Anaerostipes sp.]|uniref:ABC transporter substrate-binding protein n=1 Tax=Anaerostipes sp. TaxID=1872530 RepID=UPI0025C2F8EB|nr:ABC transporter substrate-binding protein [Anaerostipes sp.]MBS7009755.1 carbohydrate ABC transporter substrate-binding protein [Anaerostipes sp.]